MGDFQGHPFRGNQWSEGRGGVVIANDDPKVLGQAILTALEELHGPLPVDMSPEKVARNWKSEFKGRVVTDPEKVALLKGAVKENRDNPEYMQLVAAYGGEGVIVLANPSDDPKHLMQGRNEGGERMGVVTAVYASTSKLGSFTDTANDREPPRPGLPSPGLAAVLRHEFGHAIHDDMDPEVKRFAEKLWYQIPNPKETFSYYAAFNSESGDHEGFPEAIALGTDPRYRPEEWHPAVRAYVDFVLKAAGTVRSKGLSLRIRGERERLGTGSKISRGDWRG